MNIIKIVDIKTIFAWLLAGGGWTLSEIKLMTGWVEFSIKILTLVVLVITAITLYNRYKRELTEDTMRLRPGGDEEDGSAGTGPGEDDQDDDDG